MSIGSKTVLMKGMVLTALMEETEPTVAMVLSKLIPRLALGGGSRGAGGDRKTNLYLGHISHSGFSDDY